MVLIISIKISCLRADISLKKFPTHILMFEEPYLEHSLISLHFY